MKKIVLSILSLFIVLCLKAEDGHELWLRKKSAVPVKVVSPKKSPILHIAVQELEQGWQGKAGASVSLTIFTF